MRCGNCLEDGVKNQVLGKEFWYCRKCKTEIIDLDFDFVTYGNSDYSHEMPYCLGGSKLVTCLDSGCPICATRYS